MGRRPGYEVESVLRAAVPLFRAAGFRGVSVDDLVKTTGLNRFALYEKFGGKEGLFYDTVTFYHEVLIRDELLGPLFQDDASLDSLLTMLQTMRAVALDPQQRGGCLIVNANVELAGSDERVAAAAEAVMHSFREATCNVLDLASRRGEIDAAISNPDHADYVVVMIQAFFALAYISRTAAEDLFCHLFRELETWRLTDLAKVPSLSGQ